MECDEGCRPDPVKRDPEYDLIPKLPQQQRKRGSQCGECGMKFDYGQAYGYCCMNARCPTSFRSLG